MFSYDILASHAADVLDKYDLNEYLRMCILFGATDYYDVKDDMERWFKNPEITDALDDLSLDEFMEYLTARYNVVFDEYVTYKMRMPVRPVKKETFND